MAALTSPEHADHIPTFCQLIGDKLTVQAVCGRKYVCVEALRTWLRAPALTINTSTNASQLLISAYKNFDTLHRPIHELADKFLLVFSILLRIGEGDLIHHFDRRNINDDHLPMTDEKLKQTLRDLEDGRASKVASKFRQEQRPFCPVRFEYNENREWDSLEHVIPICAQDDLNEGASAMVTQILVQEEFVGEKLRSMASESKVPGTKFGNCYQFALKSFRPTNKKAFEDEIKAFRALREHDGIVRYFSDYTYTVPEPPPTAQGPTTRTPHNILLELAEHNLYEYFVDTSPPVFPKETIAFWKNLFGIAETVGGIHKFKIGESPEEYFGTHADIKPENILSIREEFKLADFGFSKFNLKKKTSRIQWATDTFGAPELRHGSDVEQKIDTWSLGALFSVAATWVIIGGHGINQYSNIRNKALRLLGEDADRFHDGENVLSIVLAWHEKLRGALRKDDPITGAVLDLIDSRMLIGDHKNRISIKKQGNDEAGDLCVELQRILHEAQQASPDQRSFPHDTKIIAEALLQQDDSALPRVYKSDDREAERLHLNVKDDMRGRSPLNPRNRYDRTTKQLAIPTRKTAGRKVALTAALKNPDCESQVFTRTRSVSGVIDEVDDVPSAILGHLPNTEEKIVHMPSKVDQDIKRWGLTRDREDCRFENHGDSTTGPTQIPKQNLPLNLQPNSSESAGGPASPPCLPPPQTISQAHHEVKSGRSTMKRLLGKQTPNELLQFHFRDRDIHFLVDNGTSMDRYWHEATTTITTLVGFAYGVDEDGMDLSFTNGGLRLDRCKEVSKFQRQMKKARPPKAGLLTDIKTSLGTIFDKWLRTGTHKDMTVYILTDGCWEGVQDRLEVDKLILDFIDKVKERRGSLKQRPFSIQFIRFGEDPEAIDHLQRLDDKLKSEKTPDIIDHEPYAGGNVWKMLLGSFNEIWDAQNSGPTTPNQHTPNHHARTNSYTFPSAVDARSSLANGMIPRMAVTGADSSPTHDAMSSRQSYPSAQAGVVATPSVVPPERSSTQSTNLRRPSFVEPPKDAYN